MEFFGAYQRTLRYYSHPLFFCALAMALTALISGCSGHQPSSLQSGVFDYEKTGVASYYAQKHQYRKTASGEIFNNNSMTAAHKTLPFGTNVLVKNRDNNKTVKVTINDRGPFIRGRIIDLSRAAFARIADIKDGLASVEIMVVD